MKQVSIDGILNIDKPYGMTSMDVVRRIKRASGQKRVGHAGTLDPVATGVVPVCLGQATRVMEYLVDSPKEYRAVIELGVTTDTYDALGEVTGRRDISHVSAEDAESALEPYEGAVWQVPPMYSALKKEGKRLYDLARSGIEVEREPRKVMVYETRLLDWSPPKLSVYVRCGRGFYMRSFAHDIGEAMGCGGHLESLVRLRSGPFQVSRALSLDEAQERFQDCTWREALHPLDVVLLDFRAIVLGKHLEDMIMNGRALPAGMRVPMSRPGEQCRAYSVDGRFLAVVVFDPTAKRWKPEKVFPTTYQRGAQAV